MEIVDSIIVFKDYGEIKFDIKTIMDSKNITINQVVIKTGLHYKVVKKYYEGLAERYDKEVLAKICYVLDCDLNDIMCYKRPKKK